MNLSFLPKRVGKILSDVGKGNEIVLRRHSHEAYDPYEEAPSGGAPAVTEYACSGVIMSPKKGRKEGGSEQAASCRLLLRADNLPVTPEPGDTMIVNGVPWTVVKNEPVQPSGKTVLHKLELLP